jgi:hypothetical protein
VITLPWQRKRTLQPHGSLNAARAVIATIPRPMLGTELQVMLSTYELTKKPADRILIWNKIVACCERIDRELSE